MEAERRGYRRRTRAGRTGSTPASARSAARAARCCRASRSEAVFNLSAPILGPGDTAIAALTCPYLAAQVDREDVPDRDAVLCHPARGDARTLGRARQGRLATKEARRMQRMGFVLGLKGEAIAEYKRLHADVWPSVLATIARCNIRNYSIYLARAGEPAFRLAEYHGERLRGRQRQDGGRSGDAALVGDLHVRMQQPARKPRRGRVVGADGRASSTRSRRDRRSRRSKPCFLSGLTMWWAARSRSAGLSGARAIRRTVTIAWPVRACWRC